MNGAMPAYAARIHAQAAFTSFIIAFTAFSDRIASSVARLELSVRRRNR
ncbi:hypothetical protein [Lysobacter enzymogenes]|nr:hypothetical protein [Lysobacter enzymogenes]